MPASSVTCRWMVRRDMPEVLAIEQQSFEFAWSEEDILSCLRQQNCIGMIAEQNDKIVGFMIYELLKSQLHLLNFAVLETSRRQGVGSTMISKLIRKLEQQKRTEIRTEVRESSIAAQLLFKALGFRATKVLRDYYEDSSEDAYLMRYLVADHKPVGIGCNRIADFM